MRMEMFFLFMLLMKFSISMGSNDGCIISTQPKDAVVLLNENATFTCAVDTQMVDNSYILFYFADGETLTSVGSKLELQNKGIISVSTGTGQFEIQVLGSEQNNGLEIKCGFPPDCFTDRAELIVVNAPPSPPEPPSVTVTNLRTLNITWSPPWPHPVNNYLLSITNEGTGYAENVTLSSNSYLYSMNQSSSAHECDVYRFRVLADTDVGLSGFSNESKPAGFPKNLSNHQELSIDVSTTMCLARSYMTYNVTATTPTVCEYETLSYEILVIYLKGGINTQDTSIDVILSDTTEPKGLFYIEHDMSSDVVFNITVVATNEAEQSLTSYSIMNSSSITKTVVNGEDYVLQPRTIVGLIGTTVTFTCSNTYTINPTHLEVNKTRVTNHNFNTDHFNDNGITWKKTSDVPTLISYNVFMNVTEKLNGTSVRCIIPCPSNTAYLIVVSSLPDPSDPPSVISIHNATTLDSLLVSWNSPWPHPVNYYTVFIRLGNSEEATLNYTTTLTSYELMKQSSQYNFTTCEALYVSIEGSTDVGETGRSNETEYGFIKGVQGINTSHLQAMPKSYSISKYSNGTTELHAVTIQMEIPDLNLCSYEDVLFSITILSTVYNISVTAEVNLASMLSSSATIYLGYFIQDDDSLEGILTVSDEANQNLSLIIFEAIVDEADQILTSSAVNTATMTSISGISPSNPVSTNYPPTSAAGVPIATVASALVSGVVAIITVVLVFGGVAY